MFATSHDNQQLKRGIEQRQEKQFGQSTKQQGFRRRKDKQRAESIHGKSECHGLVQSPSEHPQAGGIRRRGGELQDSLFLRQSDGTAQRDMIRIGVQRTKRQIQQSVLASPDNGKTKVNRTRPTYFKSQGFCILQGFSLRTHQPQIRNSSRGSPVSSLLSVVMLH